ncbi:MAG: hypothetical protein REI12_07375 [Pedobacter sp.]|nr:hypothetical protein [Pedobacter sp.]
MKKQAPTPAGNSLSLLLLLLPALALIMVWREGRLFMPVNLASFLILALPACLAAFALLWFLSFRQAERDRSLYAVTTFLLVFWMIAGLPFLGWLNHAGDKSHAYTLTRAITKIQGSPGGVRSKPSCHIWLDTEVDGVKVLGIRRDYCDIIRPGQDGIEVSLKKGSLGFAWMVDYRIVRDIVSYRERLGR